MNCRDGVCYFSKEVNGSNLSRLLRGATIREIKDQGKEVLVEVHSTMLSAVTLEDLERTLQEDNSQIDIVYDLANIDENVQKATKPIWAFSIEDNHFIKLKRV